MNSLISIILYTSISLLLISCGHSNKVPKKTKQHDKETAALHLKIGTDLLAQKKYPLALRELLLAERYNTTDPYIKNNIGLTYYYRQKFTLAKNKLNEALKLNPKFSQARNNLAIILIEQEEYSSAIKHLNIINDDLFYQEPHNGWLNLGIVYFRQKKYEKSETALKQSISLKRNQCSAYTILGRTYFEKKNYQHSSRSLEQAVYKCKSTNFEEANYYAALSYFRIGKKDIAISKMKENIKHYPNGKYIQEELDFLKITKE